MAAAPLPRNRVGAAEVALRLRCCATVLRRRTVHDTKELALIFASLRPQLSLLSQKLLTMHPTLFIVTLLAVFRIQIDPRCNDAHERMLFMRGLKSHFCSTTDHAAGAKEPFLTSLQGQSKR